VGKLISLRAYGRSRGERGLPGATLKAVQNAIASGRITPINGKIDQEVADIQWAAKTDAAQQARGLRGGHPARPQPTGKGQELKGPAAPPDTVGRSGYFDTKTRRELAEAKLSELELQEKQAELVRSADVKRETFSIFRALRDRILGVPDRLAAILAAEADTAKVHTLLGDELKNALREIAQGLAEPDPA
jgi:hypothetical protein